MKSTWQTKKLVEICNFQNGFAFKSENFKQKGSPVLRISNIQNDGISYNKLVFFDKNDYRENFDKYQVNKGDLVIAMSGATTGKIAVSDTNDVFYLNQRVGKFIPKKDLSKNYLYYFLSTKIEENLHISSGAAQPNLSTEQIKDFKIPFPPLPEQHRITKILDEVFEKIDKAKNNAEKNLQNSKNIFDSYLQNIFENPKENWGQKKIYEICEDMFAGGDIPKNNFSKTKTEKYNIPIFANGVSKKGLYGYTDIKKVSKPSVTVSARGTIGYAEIRTEAYFPIVRLIVLIPNTKIVDIYFLFYLTHNFKFTNTGTSIPQLTMPMIKNIKISIPSISEQKEIVKNLDELSEETKKLESTYKQKLADLEELKKSILNKAFNGEL